MYERSLLYCRNVFRCFFFRTNQSTNNWMRRLVVQLFQRDLGAFFLI